MTQGYARENIQFLAPHADWDVDGDGLLNDVDDVCTTATLSSAIIGWASDAGELIVFLVDHGGVGTFYANAGDIVHASDVDSWLDIAQESIPGKAVLIYDACHSGSFSGAHGPAAGKGEDRDRQLPGGRGGLVHERRDPVLQLPVLGVGAFQSQPVRILRGRQKYDASREHGPSAPDRSSGRKRRRRPEQAGCGACAGFYHRPGMGGGVDAARDRGGVRRTGAFRNLLGKHPSFEYNGAERNRARMGRNRAPGLRTVPQAPRSPTWTPSN